MKRIVSIYLSGLAFVLSVSSCGLIDSMPDKKQESNVQSSIFDESDDLYYFDKNSLSPQVDSIDAIKRCAQKTTCKKFRIYLTGSSSTNDVPQLTQERIEVVKKLLLSSGINEKDIFINTKSPKKASSNKPVFPDYVRAVFVPYTP